MIDRKAWVRRHTIINETVDVHSSLYVGNGRLAMGVDVTGMQTLYDLYNEADTPLCTMSQWGWHDISGFGFDDVEKTVFETERGLLKYAVEPMEGNEDIYNWLRHNPHRFNLVRIGLYFKNEEITVDRLEEIHQEQDLYSGVITSSFKLEGVPCHVKTLASMDKDIIGFELESELLTTGMLEVMIAFPYGHHKISGSDWAHKNSHETEVKQKAQTLMFDRTMDGTRYQVKMTSDRPLSLGRTEPHHYLTGTTSSKWSVNFEFGSDLDNHWMDYDIIALESKRWWARYWQTVGAMDFSEVDDSRAFELERRVVLSLFQSTIHGTGAMPPQETGLGCNSWYGKFHLEMHLLHSLYLPLWGKPELLEKSLQWYIEHLDTAKANARCNYFQGARWPKMVAYDGIDSPSRIATLLIWQQPHILYMLMVLFKTTCDMKYLEDYKSIIYETALFMADFVYWNDEKACYEIKGPVIPVQEEHAPMDTLNPMFEVSYWSFGLEIAAEMLSVLALEEEERKTVERFKAISKKMAPLPEHEGIYMAHENCPDTFLNYNKDHPSMVMSYGLIHDKHVDKNKMKATYKEILDKWHYPSLWGWDFAMMAMTATRLGEPEWAIEALLMDTVKNTYVANGHNYQKSRTDLPIYLPGNGSLLLALSMMAQGYDQSKKKPGFPKKNGWDKIKIEGIYKLPF